jgi:hypothetical protein
MPKGNSDRGEVWWLRRLALSFRALTATSKLDGTLVLLAVLALCVFVRLLRLQPIELYDDEVQRWHFVRQWFYDNDLRQVTWSHHMARLGVNVPLFLVQAVFGRDARVYYVWPVASFTLQVLFTYLTAERMAGRGAAVVAALLLSVFAGMDRGASQILPDAFAGTALILVCYSLVRYHDAAPNRRLPWLLAGAAALVWAYTIKESNLLFVPGTLLGVWLCGGKRRDLAAVAGVLAIAIGIETLAFRLLTRHPSRFAIVGEHHGDIPTSFWRLFDRFSQLEPAWQMLFWLWVPAALWLWGSADRRARMVVALPASFVLLLTFLVRSVDPLIIWTRFYSRYFEPVAALFALAVALFSVELSRRLAASWRSPRWQGRGGAIAIGACLLVGLLEWAAVDTFYEPALRQVERIATVTNDAYRRNLPIVQSLAAPSEPEERRARPLKLIYGVYLSDVAIARAVNRRERLPEVLEAVHDGKRYSYLLREPTAYRAGEVEAWVERGCAVVVSEEPRYGLAAAGVRSLVLRQRRLSSACQAPTSPVSP